MNIDELRIGQKIVIKNTLKKPPAHHVKKLREWERWNFNGEIEDIDSAANKILVINLDASNSVITYTFWIRLDSPERAITLS